MRTRHFAVLGLLCAALVLAGCAQSGSGSAAASSGAPSAPSAPSSPEPSGSSQSPNPPSGVTLVLTGQVEPGVEPHCLLLKDGGQTYQLMGGDPAVVKAGARVRVSGHVVDNVMSYCMQGKPFQITEAHAL